MALVRPRRKHEPSLLEELKELDMLETGETVEIPDLENEDLIEENKKSIIVRCLNKQAHKVGALIKALPSIWGLEERVKGRGIGDDKAQFHFDNEGDLNQVLDKGPWFVNGWIVTVEQWSPNPGPDYLKRIQFWIRIKGIPVHLLKRQTVECIIGSLGEVEEVELHAKKSTSVEYVRARAWVNAEAPLQFLKEAKFKSGEVLQLELTYEKLLKVCFICKRLTHDMSFCSYQVKDSNYQEGERRRDGQSGRRGGLSLNVKRKGKISDNRVDKGRSESQKNERTVEINSAKTTPRSVKERLQWIGKGERKFGKRSQMEWRVRDTQFSPKRT